MAKPSIYSQLTGAAQVRGEHLPPSPRHWNNGLLRYKGRLWMALRFHLGREHASRCAVGLVPIDKTTFQPTAPYQHLNLPATVGDEHFEDARLFLFRGQPHLSYTQMTGYQPGRDYRCTMKYARLRLNGNRWLIEQVFQPNYGRNHGGAKEKNWSFFEYDNELHVVYQDHPSRLVLKLDGDRVVQTYASDAPLWPWGEMRGGSPPVRMGDGYLALFHSSLPTEDPPHFVRYYGAAYTFEARPPFRITAVSHQPVMAGSEADGHGTDPRYSAGWKPFVVFPCGLVPPLEGAEDQAWLVSLGVNDWQCAVARVTREQLRLGRPDRSDAPLRFFTTANGSLPASLMGQNGSRSWIYWEIPDRPRLGGAVAMGLYATRDGRESEAMADAPNAEEITAGQYAALGGRMAIPARPEALMFG